MALLLYAVTTLGLIALWNRFVQPVSRAAAVVLVLLPLCFTGRALLTGRIYAPADLPFLSEPLKDYARDFGAGEIHNGTISDLYCQIIPWRYAVRHAITHGRWPLWNPFLLCGDILAANGQSAPYDPFNLLTLLIPFADGLTFSAAITFFLAGFFTFAFCRALGCSEGAALVAAPAFALSGELAFFVGWPLSRAWSFFPLVMLGARLVVREANLRSAIVLTSGFVLTIFAGHPESILHITAIGALYGAAELVARWRSDAPPMVVLVRPLLLALSSGLIALGLTAIFLLPFFEATHQSVESRTRFGPYARNALVTNQDLIARRAGVTFFPFFGGQPWHGNITSSWDPQSARTGSIVLSLALTAVVTSWKRKIVWLFGAIALLCLCAGFGAPPVAGLLHALPFFHVALNDRLAYGAAFSLAIMAAMAADSLSPNRVAAALSAGTVGVLLALATSLIWSSQRAAGVSLVLMRSMVIAELVPLLLVVAALTLRMHPRNLIILLLALTLLQRTFEDGGIYPAVSPSSFYPTVPLLARLQHLPGLHRIVARHYGFIPDSAALYELEDARGYEAMTFERLTETYPLWSQPQPVSFNIVPELNRPFLAALNVRYALGRREAPQDGWKTIAEDRETRLFENTHVLPRAFIPRRIRYERSPTAILFQMYGCQDFGETAWIEAPEVNPHSIDNGGGRVTIRPDGNGFVLDARMKDDGWVVVSESAWRGWRAYVDGRRQQTHFADHALLGIFVPRGSHQVRLVYLPDSFTTGRLISMGTLLIVLAAALWNRSKRRRDRGLTGLASR